MAPVLFLQNHTFYLHTYLPAIGIFYLVALALEDLYRFAGARRDELPYALAAFALVMLFALCFTDARRNEHIQRDDGSLYLRSFVIRRAIVAQNFCNSLREQIDPRRQVDTVLLVYGRADPKGAEWNVLNVQAAVGYGSAVRLYYGDPNIWVRFILPSELDASIEGRQVDVFLHDDVGNLRRIVRSEKQ